MKTTIRAIIIALATLGTITVMTLAAALILISLDLFGVPSGGLMTALFIWFLVASAATLEVATATAANLK